ncbi:MAG: autotransporter-associated beta strand repeat-containing protein [Kiritimatiellae bacterium]|nr:autotransporter-associated beta strand repeat-containing protein [Kiritimatiellia bacterium]
MKPIAVDTLDFSSLGKDGKISVVRPDAIHAYWMAMMCKCIIFLFAVLPASQVFAVRTNQLLKGASNWAVEGSYELPFVPSTGDVVVVQEESTNYLYSTDAQSVEIVTNLGAVILKGLGNSSTLIVDVPEGMTNHLHCPVFGSISTSPSWKNGELVKTGSGWLDLMSIGNMSPGVGMDYFTGIRVKDGTLRLPQNCNGGGAGNEKYCQIGFLVIEDSATFIPAKCPESTGYGTTYIKGLSGGGTLLGHADKAYWFIVKDTTPYGAFSGKVENYILPRIENGGTLELTGVQSTGFKVSGFRINDGTLKVGKFGNKNEASSLGGTTTFQIDLKGGRIVYLGEGEKSNRDFQIYATDKPFYLDGGAHGGLVLVGSIANHVDSTGDPHMMRKMVFTGSNEVPCVYAGAIKSTYLSLGDINYALYMVKEGSGTWRFADNPGRENANGFAVREGTLQFESLLEAGLICSLGTSTNLTDGYLGRYDANRAKPYAFDLGGSAASGAANEATFEYVGATGVVCTTRPIVLSGNAKIKNDTAHAFRFKGVSGIGNNVKILSLAGSNSGQNEISCISDGIDGGCVGVRKTGSGTWRISGDMTFSGGISVDGGKLVVVNPATNSYSWFRWTIKNVNSESGEKIYCEEFGLFDKHNMRQNVGLSVRELVADIAPGEASTEFPVSKYTFLVTGGTSSYPGNGTIDCMFNHKRDYGMVVKHSSFNGDRKNWFSVTMRLTNGAPEIASFDFCYPYANTSGSAIHCPKVFTLEGSLNGLDWDSLYMTDSACSAYPNVFRWQSAGDEFLNNSSYCHPGGYPIRGYALRDFDVLKNIGTVSVSGGGILEIEGRKIEIKSIAVDATSEPGTIRNAKFPKEGGELNVSALKEGASAMPLQFVDCDGVENIAKWSLLLDGKSTTKKIVFKNGIVHVVPAGMMVLLR